MRYCPRCNTEYRDDQTVCTEDGVALVDKASHDVATAKAEKRTETLARLTSVLSLSDGFEAEELATGLFDEGLDASLVSNRTATLATLTDPGPEVFNIVVPESEADRARAFLAEWRPGLEAQQAAAQFAAEEEEATGEAAAK